MYHDGKMKEMDGDDLSLMHVYLRSQAGRFGSQKLDWFFDQPELLDDGDHPLLEDEMEPQYSRDVMRRAFTTWAMLDNKNPFKFVCNYYHALEKMAENSPQHVRDYVRRSLDIPASFQENPDQIFAQHRRVEVAADSPYSFNQNSRPCFYKNHADSTYLRNQVQRPVLEFGVNEYAKSPIHGIPIEQVSAYDVKTPTDVYERYCKSLSYKMYGPMNETNEATTEREVIEGMKAHSDVKMCQSQVSIDSTPSKSSENDSCYQSMNSPLTDLEE